MKWLKRYVYFIAQNHTLGHSDASVSSNLKTNMAREYPDVRTFSLLLVILRYRRKMLQNISMMLPKTNGIEACIGDLVEHYQS